MRLEYLGIGWEKVFSRSSNCPKKEPAGGFLGNLGYSYEKKVIEAGKRESWNAENANGGKPPPQSA